MHSAMLSSVQCSVHSGSAVVYKTFKAFQSSVGSSSRRVESIRTTIKQKCALQYGMAELILAYLNIRNIA